MFQTADKGFFLQYNVQGILILSASNCRVCILPNSWISYSEELSVLFDLNPLLLITCKTAPLINTNSRWAARTWSARGTVWVVALAAADRSCEVWDTSCLWLPFTSVKVLVSTLGGGVCGLCHHITSSVTLVLSKKFLSPQRRGKGSKDFQQRFCEFPFFTSKVQNMSVTFLRESLCLKQQKNPLWQPESFVSLDLCLMDNFCHSYLFSEIPTPTLFRRDTRKLSPERPSVIITCKRDRGKLRASHLIFLANNQHCSIVQSSCFTWVLICPNRIANANRILKFAKSSNLNYIC